MAHAVGIRLPKLPCAHYLRLLCDITSEVETRGEPRAWDGPSFPAFTDNWAVYKTAGTPRTLLRCP